MCPKTAGDTSAFLIVSVIEVRQAEGVGIFVAECSNAAYLFMGLAPLVESEQKFRGACIPVDPCAVQHKIDAGSLVYVPCVGPYAVFRASFGFVMPGEKDEDIVGFTVLVIIIDREIYLIVSDPAGITYHFRGLLVIAVGIVCSVVCSCLRQSDDVRHMEIELQKAIELVVEIVLCTAGSSVYRISFFVEKSLEILLRVLELDVAEACKNDKTMLDCRSLCLRHPFKYGAAFSALYLSPLFRRGFGNEAIRNMSAFRQHLSRNIRAYPPSGRYLPPVRTIGSVAPPAVFVLYYRMPFGRGLYPRELVSPDMGHEYASIRLGQADRSPSCGNA